MFFIYSQIFVGGNLDIYVKPLRWKVEGLCPKGKSRRDFKIVHVSRVPCVQFSCGRRPLFLALGQSGVIVSAKAVYWWDSVSRGVGYLSLGLYIICPHTKW